jgi:hypothetical protein
MEKWLYRAQSKAKVENTGIASELRFEAIEMITPGPWRSRSLFVPFSHAMLHEN